MKRTADISACAVYRYTLGRQWADGPHVCFVMLNPSRADSERDDATVTRCINYAKAWGFGRLTVRNLYPFRTTYPRELKAAMKAGVDVRGGALGEQALREATDADLVLCAWGVNASGLMQDAFVQITAPVPLWCLGLSIGGQPLHPLMQRAKLAPLPWKRRDGVTWEQCRDAGKVAF